jgi:hypothetical protein
MTRDEALKLALEVLERASDAGYSIECEEAVTALRKALVQPDPVLAERESCAQLCDKAAKDWDLNAWDDDADEKYGHKESACGECADAIRARSQP